MNHITVHFFSFTAYRLAVIQNFLLPLSHHTISCLKTVLKQSTTQLSHHPSVRVSIRLVRRSARWLLVFYLLGKMEYCYFVWSMFVFLLYRQPSFRQGQFDFWQINRISWPCLCILATDVLMCFFMFAGRRIIAVATLRMDEIKTITPSNAELYPQ